MTASLGAELRRRRQAAGLTQGAVASQLGVQRPNVSQWEADRHRPSPEHLSRLDELYNARGALLDLVAAPEEPGARLTLADVFQEVGDALVDRLVVDPKRGPLGWSHHLTQDQPTPLSTAYALRTLQMLDQTARVDVHALARRLEQRHTEEGWSNRPGSAKPEVTAVVLGAMARAGHIRDVDEELDRLEASIDDTAMSRPYVLSVILDCVLAIRPHSGLADRLTLALLNARTHTGSGLLLWTMNASADPEVVQPSLAHTARATTVLRQVRSSKHRSEIDDALGVAIPWIVDPGTTDDGVTEILRDPQARAKDVPVNHFTASWVLRALAGIEDVPHARRQAALDALWDCYTRLGLWAWRSDGSLPSWMTQDAVAALRFHTFTTSATSVMAKS